MCLVMVLRISHASAGHFRKRQRIVDGGEDLYLSFQKGAGLICGDLNSLRKAMFHKPSIYVGHIFGT